MVIDDQPWSSTISKDGQLMGGSWDEAGSPATVLALGMWGVAPEVARQTRASPPATLTKPARTSRATLLEVS
jgi:hypothetical protein